MHLKQEVFALLCSVPVKLELLELIIHLAARMLSEMKRAVALTAHPKKNSHHYFNVQTHFRLLCGQPLLSDTEESVW